MLTLTGIRPLRLIRPLAYQFTTSFATREYISHIITVLNWRTPEGRRLTSYGEATTHSEPFFNGEFDQTVLAYLNRASPHLITNSQFESPDDLHYFLGWLKFTKNNRFAIASLDLAFNDAFAQYEGKSLAQFIIDYYKYPASVPLPEIPVGVSRGLMKTPQQQAEAALSFVNKGNKKIKLKIKPGHDLEYVKAVYEAIKDKGAHIIVDANSSYNPYDRDHQKILSKIADYVFMIEQPFFFDDLWHHAQFVARLMKQGKKAKVCLDESINNFVDVKLWIDQIIKTTGLPLSEFAHMIAINIKLSRIGGLAPAMQVANFCRPRKIFIMPGGMHEFIFGQGAIVAFSSIDPNFGPGDSEGSETYYPQSLTKINKKVFDGLNTNSRGYLTVPSRIGLGVGELDLSLLKRISTNTYIATCDIQSGAWSPPWNPKLLQQVLNDVHRQDDDLCFTSSDTPIYPTLAQSLRRLYRRFRR